MLKQLRKQSKIVIWCVIATFVLWGGFSLGTSLGKKGRIAGEVFGKEVTFQEFDMFYKMNQIFSFSQESPTDPEVLYQETWKSILYAREAKKRKIKVTDDEVRNEIYRLLTQSGIENVTPQVYKVWLQRTVREPAKQFEKQVREVLRIQKLLKEILNEPIEEPTPKDALDRWMKDAEQFQFTIILFNSDNEAHQFAENFSESIELKKVITQFPNVEIRETSLQTRQEFALATKMAPALIQEIFQLEEKTISRPLLYDDKRAIFYAKKVNQPVKLKLEAEEEKKYLEQLKKERTQLKLFQWHFSLWQQANFKDYSRPAEIPNK